MKRKHIILVTSILFLILVISSGLIIAHRTKTQIHEIFQLNQERKREGYYLSEFEWEMLGTAYYLDHGQYIKALSTLNTIHKKLTTTEGLLHIPTFSSDEEKLEFYLHLQNPKTGAFQMDDSFPLFTYIGNTANMIDFIEDVSKNAQTPFRLKYPLTFLDDIHTPEKLRELLDDISRVGWIGAQFKTPYVCLAELQALIEQAERLDLYAFSPEWKQTFYQWCYDNQDEETGLWGARSRRTNTLLHGGSLDDSEKIIKLFIDHDGNEIHPEFPLKYRDTMFATALEKLSVPMPDDLDELHEWILIKDRGIRFLTRYLWNNATVHEKEATRKLLEEFVKIRFEQYYIKNEGAFSLYPHAEHADLDGTGEALGMYKYTGALSREKQQRLWGDPQHNVLDLGTYEVSEMTEDDFAVITKYSDMNSLRFYAIDPTSHHLDEHVEGVFYPRETSVLDIVDVLPKLEEWVKTTPQNMGNWMTKENILQNFLADIHIEPVPVSQEMPLEQANEILQRHCKLVIIGFDVLQIPRYKMTRTCAIRYNQEQ